LSLEARGNSMRLWNEKTRLTLALDGTDSAEEKPSLILLFGAQEATRTFYVELTSPSASLRDYAIRSDYLGKGETVRATAVWSVIAAYEAETRTDVAVMADDPWSYLGVYGPVAAGIAMHHGTGVRLIDGNGVRNVIVQAWQPMPEGILNIPRVKFDITRRVDWVRLDSNGGAFAVTGSKTIPVRLDEVNDDDPGLSDEDGPVQGLFFVYDAPGVASLPVAPVTSSAHRYNFEEFVRVNINGERPTGNDTIVGSRASYKFLWHSRDQVRKVGADWSRVAAFDEIGEGHDFTTEPN
jgi:hypothetical protein